VPTFTPQAIADLDLSNPVPSHADLSRCASARVLLRLHGSPLGIAAAPIADGRIDADALFRDILESHAAALAAPLAERALSAGAAPHWPHVSAVLQCRPASLPCTPRVTIAVRASGDAGALPRCLEALNRIEYPALETVVVDAESLEDRVLKDGKGEVLVVVDDSVSLDRGWVGAVIRVFLSDPDTMAVTGLVLPRAGRAPRPEMLRRKWHRGPCTRTHTPLAVAFWKSGVGTLVLEDVLRAGHTVVHEPAALGWHSRRLVADPIEDSQARGGETAVRAIDLADTPRSIADATQHDALRLDVSWGRAAIGSLVIPHRGGIVSSFRIQDAIAHELGWEILDARLRLGRPVLRAVLTSELARHLLRQRSAASTDACPQWVAPRPAAA
jgi:hypothetical protein